MLAVALYVSSGTKLKAYMLGLPCPLTLQYVKHIFHDATHVKVILLTLRHIGAPPNTRSAFVKGFLVAPHALGFNLLLKLKFDTISHKFRLEMEAAWVHIPPLHIAKAVIIEATYFLSTYITPPASAILWWVLQEHENSVFGEKKVRSGSARQKATVMEIVVASLASVSWPIALHLAPATRIRFLKPLRLEDVTRRAHMHCFCRSH